MEEEFLESEVLFSGDYSTTESDDPDLSPELSHHLFREHPSSSNNCIKRKHKKRANENPSTPISIRPGYNISRSKEVAHHSQAYEDHDEDAEFEELVGSEAVVINGDRGKMVPPHVIVAKRIAAKMTTSVYAASGRALRGRDLCQVRNSILRMTGFLET